MISKIVSLITKNLVWKIMALVLACVLWVIAVNIEDPLENRLFGSVQVGFENMETLERLGLVLLNQEDIERNTVAVRLFANRRLLSQLESSDLRAYVDLSAAIFREADWGAGESISAPFSLRLPPGAAASIITDTVIPTNVRLVIDRIDTREFPISVMKIGDPLVGYISMEPRINPQTVQITGASTFLDSIVHVRTEVELSDASEDYITSVKIIVYNENNIDITNKFVLEPAEIEVFVPINRRGQVPVMMPSFTGTLPYRHVITNVQIDPPHIDVVGSLEDIEAFRGVVLEPIDISGFTSTAIFNIDVRDAMLATPLSIQNSRPHEVFVTVVIEREDVREFIVPVESIEIIGELPENYELELPEYLELRLIGLIRIIDNVYVDDISLSINISALGEGTHDVPVILILPDGVRRAEPNVDLTITIIGEEINDEYEAEYEVAPN